MLPLCCLGILSSAAHAADVSSFSATSAGTNNSTTLAANLNIANADLGKTGNIYLGLRFQGYSYFQNGTTWVQYAGGAIPIFESALLSDRSIDVALDEDLSSLVGAELYVGYGLNESDMLENGKFDMVYAVEAQNRDASIEQVPARLSRVALGLAGNYAILAKTAVSTVPPSRITGNVGVSPAAKSFLTGFGLTMAGTFYATSPQVVGKLYGADMTAPTNANLTVAVLNMQAAYTDAAGRAIPNFIDLGAGEIGGKTLKPGIYKWATSVGIATDVTLSGGPNDVWIFQIAGNLTQASGKSIRLKGGAQAKNIFWQVAGLVEVGTTAHFEGNILCQTEITLKTNSSITGRLLAQSMVALQSATVKGLSP
jgi:hypothetical protein